VGLVAATMKTQDAWAMNRIDSPPRGQLAGQVLGDRQGDEAQAGHARQRAGGHALARNVENEHAPNRHPFASAADGHRRARRMPVDVVTKQPAAAGAGPAAAAAAGSARALSRAAAYRDRVGLLRARADGESRCRNSAKRSSWIRRTRASTTSTAIVYAMIGRDADAQQNLPARARARAERFGDSAETGAGTCARMAAPRSRSRSSSSPCAIRCTRLPTFR
jgi:hypothetical protein